MRSLFHRKHKTQKQEDTDNASQKTSQNITVRRYKSPFYDCNKFIHEDIGMAGVAIAEMNNLLEIGKVEQGGNKMRPLIYTISKSYGGKIEDMDEEEFKKILNEVYDAGYEDGKAQATRIYPSTPPIEPTPMPLSDPPY